MITGSSALHQRIITGTKIALRFWLLTSEPTPICLCKSFHTGHVRELRTFESKTRTYHVRLKSGARRTAGRGRAGLDANIIDRPGDKGPSHTSWNRRHDASTPPQKHNLSIPKPGHTAGGKQIASTTPQKHKQARSYVYRMRERNQRLTRGLSLGREALFLPGCGL